MVNVDKIRETLRIHYNTAGTVTIDPETGVVDVEGDVHLRSATGSLEVTFGNVVGSFICANTYLKSLAGAPHTVGGDFRCENNLLTNLVHGPKMVGGMCHCAYQNLTSLQGAPLEVNGEFLCMRNQLTSLEHMPQKGVTHLNCQYNPILNLDHINPHMESVSCSYYANLPLLRLLSMRRVFMGWDTPLMVEQIMDKYAGEGKPGAIKAAGELIKAGFKYNARW